MRPSSGGPPGSPPRTPGSDLLAVHVNPDDGLAPGRWALDIQRALVASVGGSFQLIPGEDIPETLLGFARAENATRSCSARARAAGS